MFTAICVVIVIAFVITMVSSHVGNEVVESGSDWGHAISVGGFIGSMAFLLVFGHLSQSWAETPSNLAGLSMPFTPLYAPSTEFVIYAPAGCVVYFKTESDHIRPVKSNGKEIFFEKNENSALLYGQKCIWQFKVVGPRQASHEYDQRVSVVIRI
ncbi:MAG: hypothetical protein WC725_00370 [Patescibacteria group bacterium]|jgi:hypothetical protein